MMDQEKSYPQRTNKQNRSGHLYFTMVADALNEAGYEQHAVMVNVVYDIPNTMESIKNIFKAFAKAMYNKESTADLTTKEFSEIAEVLNRELSEKLGVELPDYPSVESLMMQQRGWTRDNKHKQ
ncbi:MAG: hypothetical protein Q8910_06555 [Bacteroidota bacterium]|nr:hypothetical protein [Bacteroidota bacterium]